MRIIQKTKISSCPSEEIYNAIVMRYFDFLNKEYPSIGLDSISELLRNSLCKYFGLQTKGYTPELEEASDICVQALMPIFDRYKLNDITTESKIGLLEACVHCIELSKERVIGIRNVRG